MDDATLPLTDAPRPSGRRVVKLDSDEEAPTHLSAEARRVWAGYVEGWALDFAGRQILQLAMECLDRMRMAQRQITRDGLQTKGRMNPAVIIERDSRLAMLKALRQLGLDVEPLHDRPGRRPGRPWREVG